MALKRATYTRPSGQVPGPDESRDGRGGRCKTLGVSLGGAAVGADLGGSSKYSNENFEGRRGERFHIARFARASKGNRVKIPEPGTWRLTGNVRESGDVGGGLGKSYLFCLTACPPWKRLSRRVGSAAGRAPHVARCPVRPRRPLKIRRTECLPRPVVLITASGLQGEQPLGRWNNVGKGSRQNGSVTSGKGLALRAGHGGPSPEPVGCRRTARAAFRGVEAGRRVPAGGRTGNGSFGGLPRGVEQPTQNCAAECQSEENSTKRRVTAGVTMTLLSETTAKGTGLAESAGKEDPVELDSSPTFTNTNRESVPNDPLDLRNLKLEVSEKYHRDNWLVAAKRS
ncbi:hypothetical protein L2E82_53075 [Cichorium intybus]|nr:hypothetical protein L2E82_53075 [Cichorium intybus]